MAHTPRLRDFLSGDLLTFRPDMPLAEAIAQMVELGYSGSVGIGGNGGEGGEGNLVGVRNLSRILTLGDDAYGIFAQSVGGGGGNGGFSLSGSASGGDTFSVAVSVGAGGLAVCEEVLLRSAGLPIS